MGRRFRKMAIAEAQSVPHTKSRSNGITCAECPKRKDNWCLVFAKITHPENPACNYGRVSYAAKRQSERWNGKRGQGKQPHTEVGDERID